MIYLSYEKLNKVFYKQGLKEYEKEIDKRKNSYGSYDTGLSINVFHKGEITGKKYNLFYVNTHDLARLSNQVHVNSSKISKLIGRLPDFVVAPYFYKLIVNDAQSNNEIEGVKSTRKELNDILSEIKSSKVKHRRFLGLMKTYLYIDRIDEFKEISDFRKLYDNLVSAEIDIEDAPDGQLFRSGYVEINDGIKKTHIGVSSEERIKECLRDLIAFLEGDEHLELYKYMVAHYYYEYIHPFYDGNGRTGRLLVGSYLSKYLEKYSAVTFSYSINKNKSKYYSALEEITGKLNSGEITFYLIDMLKLLSEGQESIIEDLEINLAKLERISDYFEGEEWSSQRDKVELLNVLACFETFLSDGNGVLSKELEVILGKSNYLLRKLEAELLSEGLMEVISKRPKRYALSEGLMESIFNFK